MEKIKLIQNMYKAKNKINEIAKSIVEEEKLNRIKDEIRRVKGPLCRLPDFIIVGAQRGGTTSLYNYLGKHPKVYPPLYKEIHFFDENFERVVNWYKSKFPFRVSSKGMITGESSPYYIYHPLAPRRIASIVPNVKLIFLLRNPAERAISHYWHEVTHTKAENLTMKEAFNVEKKRIEGEKNKLICGNKKSSFNHRHYSYLDRGKYILQINRFEDFFRDEQMMIIKSERFFESTEKVLTKVFSFLDIDIESIKTPVFNKGDKKDKPSNHLLKKVKKFFLPYNQVLENEKGIRFK